MKPLLIGWLVILGVSGSGAQGVAPGPLNVVDSVDLGRYMGTWYEIARLPNRFQNSCAGDVTATYSLLDDGQIKVVNRCRKGDGTYSEAEGRARRAREGGPAGKLEVRFAPAILSFLPFVWGDYWIIDLAPDYSYAVIGEPDREYLWILSRSPGMNNRTLGELLDRAKAQGYNLEQLIQTRHSGETEP